MSNVAKTIITEAKPVYKIFSFEDSYVVNKQKKSKYDHKIIYCSDVISETTEK